MSTSTVRILFTGNATGAVRSVNQLEKSFTGVGRAAKFASLGIVGGLAAATKAAVDFDREMRNVNTIAKLSEKQFKAVSKQVLALSKDTGQAPKTLAKGMYDIVSSGFKANDAIKILRVSAKAATAGLTDTATATKAINAALNAYHLKATDARKVSDVLFQTVNKGVLTFEELAQNMGDLVPAAAPLGVRLEEVGAAIATITLQGVPAAEAATRVKNTMLQLASPSKELKKLFLEQGFASAEAAIKARGFSGVLEVIDKATRGNVTATAALTPEIRSLLGVVGLTGKNMKIYQANLLSMKEAQNGAGATAKAFAEQGKSIAVQWDRTKAALIAAAIPLGQQLFPLLQAGAGKVQQFAEALPELEARFGRVAHATGEFAGALGQVASNQQGQAVIVGILGALAASSGAGKLRELKAGIGALGLAGSIAAVGIGTLAGGIWYLTTAADKNAQALDRMRNAAQNLSTSSNQLADARLREQQTATMVETAELALTRARRNAQQMLGEYGRKSLEYKEAANSVTLAEQALTQAKRDARRASQDAKNAEGEASAAKRENTQATKAAYEAAKRLTVQAQQSAYSSKQDALAKDSVRAALWKYADAIHDAEKAAGSAAGKTRAYAQAVETLFVQLGRLPTTKEVKIYVRTIQSLDVVEGNRLGLPVRGGPVKRAGGGFIPMTPGSVAGTDSVPALLTPGEIVLNRSQQNLLGGPRALASLFGFSPSAGGGIARFAGGGIAGSPISQLGRVPRRGGPSAKATAVSAAGKRAFRAVGAVQQAESDLDRAYGQLGRGFSLTDEQFIVSGPDGTETVDSKAVAKRLSEIDQLVRSRRQMLRLIDTEKQRLADAVAALRDAVQALLAAIAAEQKAAADDAREIARLARQTFPDGKKGEAGRKARDARVDRLRASQGRHEDTLGRLRGDLSDVRGDLGTALQTRDHDVQFRRRDIELDIRELLGERRTVASTKAAVAAPPFDTGSMDTGSSGGSGGDSSGGDALSIVPSGSDQSALIQYLTEQLGQTRLALGIQNVQVPILGAFQKGTIHLPADGLYYGHAGEQITPAGVNRGPMEPSWQGTRRHEITLDLGDKVNQMVDRRVIELTPDISLRIGREASRLAREGTY